MISSVFGAAQPGAVGVCHPHKPRPSSTVHRLQVSLQGLARRTGDSLVSTGADGLVGAHTVSATNRGLSKYAKGAPPTFTTGKLSRGQVISFAPQLAAFIERAPSIAGGGDALAVPDFSTPASAPAAAPAVSAPSSGGSPMPPYGPSGYYAPTPSYYGPSYGPSYYPSRPRGPGGLPTDRATLDVKAFIPAQYEHLNIHPGTGMAIVVVGVVVGLMVMKNRKEK